MKDTRFSAKRFGLVAVAALLILLLILCISQCGRQSGEEPAPETTAGATAPVMIRTVTEAATLPAVETTVPTEETAAPTDETAAPTTLPADETEPLEDDTVPEDIDVPDPGTPENPYVEVVNAYPADVESVNLSAETGVSYLIAGSAGSVITIADPGVTLTIEDVVYSADAATGVLTVDLSKLGMDPLMTLTNVSASAGSCLVTLNEGLGGSGNPEILLDPAEIAVSLLEGDANGYHYQWTATTDGTVELQLKETPEAAEDPAEAEESAQAEEETQPEEPLEEPVVLEIVVTAGEETFRLTDVENGILSFEVEKNMPVLIQVITVPWTDGYYPGIEETVLWKLLPALGTIENPQVLTEIGEIAVSLKEEDEDGYHYLWTANREGRLTLTPDEGIAVTAMLEEAAYQAAEGENAVSLDMAKDQQVLIQAVAIPVPQQSEDPAEDEDPPEDGEPAEDETTEEPAEPVMVRPAVSGKITGQVTSFPGAPDNPVILESIETIPVSLEAGNADGYSCMWTAPMEGTLTLRAETTDTALEIRVTEPDGTVHTLTNQEMTLDLPAGDSVTILVIAIADEDGSYPVGDVTLTGIFAAAPGVSAENPIILSDLAASTTVAMEARQTLYFSGMVHEMIATVEDANGVSIQHGDKTVWGSQTGVAAMEFPEADAEAPEEPVVFSVTSKNEKELTLTFAYPTGHAQNPAPLAMGENKIQLKDGMTEGYLFGWTADCDGFLTIAMEQKSLWQYQINNLTAGTEGQLYTAVQEPLTTEETVEVKAGDRLQILVKTLDPRDSDAAPAGKLTVTASFFDPLLGTEAKPIGLDNTHNAVNSITIPAGQTLFYSVQADGMDMMLTGAEVTVSHLEDVYHSENGKLELRCQGETSVFAITNSGEKDARCSLTFVYPEGHRKNPLDLVIGENTAVLEEGNLSGCAFSWAAESAGELTVSMDKDSGWQFILVNETTGVNSVVHTSQDEPKVSTEMMETAAGDRILLIVNSFDPEHPLRTPAGEIPFTVEFVDPTLGMEENPIWLNLSDEISIPAGKTMYCTAKADGMILTLRGLGLKVTHNGEEHFPEQNVITFLCRGAGTFGHPVFAITNTSASDGVFEIEFTYPEGHFMNPAELELGETTIAVEECGKSGIYFLWTSDVDGVLNFRMETETGWSYSITNLTSGTVGETHTASDEEPVYAESVPVGKGDQLRIIVNFEEEQEITFHTTTSAKPTAAED